MRCNLDGSNLEERLKMRYRWTTGQQSSLSDFFPKSGIECQEVVSGVHVQGIATDADGKVYWTASWLPRACVYTSFGSLR